MSVTSARLVPAPQREERVGNEVVIGSRTSTGAVMFALLVACFAFQLNASMLSPALKLMESELNATTAEIGLTQTAFFTSAAVLSLFLPRLADLKGRRRTLVVMMGLTAIGCIISALSPNVTWLFVGRIIQGVAGPTVVMCLIVLRIHVRNPQRYAVLMGVITAVNGGIAGVDAIAGGWLAQNYGFASIFAVMAVTAVIAALALWFFTNESRVDNPPRMDWRGTGLLVLGVGALYLAFNELAALSEARWVLIGGLLVVSALAFGIFIRLESRIENPLVSIATLKRRESWVVLVTTLLTLTGVFAVMNQIVPAIAQDAELGTGLSAAAAPFLTLTPYALAGLAMGPLAGYLAGKYGYMRILQIGLVGAVVSMSLALLLIGRDTTWLLVIVSVLVGIFYAGMANIMLNGLCVVLSPADSPGILPGLNAGAFNLGAGLSFVILPLIQTIFTGRGEPAVGYAAGIVTGLVILAAALLTSCLLPKGESTPAE
ncbi:MFS transporter [Actinotignum sanguinis]|uniref:uridine transporter UriT n=1 Tax=Actinotignum sanguinis TaxID=1445614 RepID=UPI000F7D6C72|nr:MFS transporter [Actinotignum sanguinis]MDY5147847.1 MFS transporter [Actinotignum sanguinis]RTE49723.1 MFS transporter [Actinotignum sanguinis]